jgi:hypothetical protein
MSDFKPPYPSFPFKAILNESRSNLPEGTILTIDGVMQNEDNEDIFFGEKPNDSGRFEWYTWRFSFIGLFSTGNQTISSPIVEVLP